MKITDVRERYQKRLENLDDRYKYSWNVDYPEPEFSDLVIEPSFETDFDSEFFVELDSEERIKSYYYGLSKLSSVEIIEVDGRKNISVDLDLNENKAMCTLIKAKAGSESTIVISKKGNSKLSFEYLKVIAEKDAIVNIITFQNMNYGCEAYQYYSAIAKENAEVNFACMHAGSKFSKGFIINSLEGKYSRGNIDLFYYGKESQVYDFYTSSIHDGRDTTSNILTRGALDDRSQALSRGLVKINARAYNSNGQETQEAILLSNEAKADAIPNLEIHNQEVSCSHGSSISEIDEDQIMYLMSRGFSRELAENKLVEGFFIPAIDKISDEEIRESFKEKIIEIIEGQEEERIE